MEKQRNIRKKWKRERKQNNRILEICKLNEKKR